MNLRNDLRQKAPDILGSSNTQLTFAITQIFYEMGGVEGLVQRFSEKGLDEVITSWISKESNKTVSMDQIKTVLGTDLLDGIAARVGIPPETLCHQISLYLPLLVDELSPDGKIPSNTWWSHGMKKLKQLFRLSSFKQKISE